MIQPKPLQKGDTIGIVCTARSFEKSATIDAVQLAQSWGFRVELGETIGENFHQLGGDDTLRAKDLQKMIDNPHIKAIWIARGGYGTVRIIDQIDFSPLAQNPKWIIGFSDITVLHSHLHQLGFCSIHAIMPYSIPKATEDAKNSLYMVLTNRAYDINYSPISVGRIGQSEGTLVGGNLSILYSLLGSKSAIDTNDKILFLEDLDEYLYHIDRMMQNLKRNGYFNRLKGLIIGGMTDMHDNQIPYGYDVKAIIMDVVKDFQFPVVFDFPAGHIPDNRALIFGKTINLTVTDTHAHIKYLT